MFFGFPWHLCPPNKKNQADTTGLVYLAVRLFWSTDLAVCLYGVLVPWLVCYNTRRRCVGEGKRQTSGVSRCSPVQTLGMNMSNHAPP